MNIEKLLRIYSDQSANMEELLDVALEKQRAIINNQRENLEKFTIKEETCLSKINRKEFERTNCLESIFKEAGMESELANIKDGGDVLNQLKLHTPNDSYTTLLDARTAIRECTKKVSEVNKQNLFLIEQANSIVKQTLSILLSSQKKPLLDRRV